MTRKKNQNILTSLFISLLLFSVVIFLFMSNFRLYQKRADVSSILHQLEEKTQELEEEKEQIEQQIKEVGSEDFLEKIAREKLNLIKPGEQVVVVKIETEEEEEEEIEEESSFWDFDWLF